MTLATRFRIAILAGVLLALAVDPLSGQTGMTAHREVDSCLSGCFSKPPYVV